MKQLYIRSITLVIVIALLLAVGMLSISAEEQTELILSTQGVTDQFVECGTYTLQSTIDGNVYGEDVGIWFFTSTIGLDASYVRTYERHAVAECRADDFSMGSEYLIVRSYVIDFATVNGYYRPCVNHTIAYTNPAVIDDDGYLYLRMMYYVEARPGDGSNVVPRGLMRYAFWAY